MHKPETMRQQVEEQIESEIAALRNPERKIKAWTDRLEEADRTRVAYQRQQAEGLMTLEELRAHLSELDERRGEAESELEALRDSQRRIDELRAYSNLIDEYLNELPRLVHGSDKVIRDYTYTEEHEERDKQAREESHLPIFTVSPEMFRGRPRRWRSFCLHRSASAPNATGVCTLVLASELSCTKMVPWS